MTLSDYKSLPVWANRSARSTQPLIRPPIYTLTAVSPPLMLTHLIQPL